MSLFKRIYFILVLQLVVLSFSHINASTTCSEIAYLQTDRTVYIAGESIYYKLYVLDAATKKCSVMSKVGYIVLRAANSATSLKIRVKIDAGMANGSFSIPDTLTSGVYQIIAFTSAMKNLGEENFFHNEITIANRFDKALDFKLINSSSKDSSLSQIQGLNPIIRTDKVLYGMRQKVTVDIGKTTSKANVSASVFEDSPIPSTYKSFAGYLNYWSTTRNSKPPELNYYSPETKGKILRGSVVDSKTKQTIKDAIVLLSCVDTIPNLQYAVTNSNGMFQLLLNDYYNGKELFLTIKDAPENQNWQIKVEDEFAQYKDWNPSLISEIGVSKDFIGKSQNIVYINKSYHLTNYIDKQVIENKSICPRFYNCPVTTLLLSDFVPLDSFSEIVVELLPQVIINKDKGKYQIRMFSHLTKNFQNENPAIFLDGVYVDDINKIMELGSEQIKKIELISERRAFGNLVFDGVISFTSKTKEMINSIPASYSLRFKNDNVNTGGKLIAYDPNTLQNKNIPFIRQLLYWNPNMELSGTDDTKFEFYTSDNLAKFSIKVEGISEDGTPLSASSRIEVTNQINVTDK
jgi:hypothetical protein